MQASRPFLFMACAELRQTLGEEADDEKRLVELLETVPLDSIYFHTHSYFLRHSYVERMYPNDFAQWVAMEVRDHVLGERLCSHRSLRIHRARRTARRADFSHRRSFVDARRLCRG